jgi:hypothetical protein
MGIVKVFEEIFKVPKKEEKEEKEEVKEVKEFPVVKEEVKIRIRTRRLIVFTKKVPPSSMITRYENYVEFPYKVLVVSAHLYFPPGCEDLVEVSIGAGSYIFADRIASGDGKDLHFGVNRFVEPHTPIWVEISNYDLKEPHTPTIEIEIEEYI